ncbi:MAG: hypothetical protein UU36_C0047G0007 [Candidatus Uhrbacteria bacterium GW2011_GWE2_41_1153]|nr:MAG: hypothetical protein UU36_C0047G0007 [Candidatus Uhrbacteria bacterium GW2011_GWE2_41_1153]
MLLMEFRRLSAPITWLWLIRLLSFFLWRRAIKSTLLLSLVQITLTLADQLYRPRWEVGKLIMELLKLTHRSSMI